MGILGQLILLWQRYDLSFPSGTINGSMGMNHASAPKAADPQTKRIFSKRRSDVGFEDDLWPISMSAPGSRTVIASPSRGARRSLSRAAIPVVKTTCRTGRRFICRDRAMKIWKQACRSAARAAIWSWEPNFGMQFNRPSCPTFSPRRRFRRNCRAGVH
jgi:hypothetical protein